MKKPPYSIRQGDVLLVAATYRGPMPADSKPVESTGRIVLAYGEVTGHAHAIQITGEPPAKYFDANAERFLHALLEIPLGHEEHSAVILSPGDPAKGKYQQAFQVEDFGEEVRRVAD